MCSNGTYGKRQRKTRKRLVHLAGSSCLVRTAKLTKAMDFKKRANGEIVNKTNRNPSQYPKKKNNPIRMSPILVLLVLLLLLFPFLSILLFFKLWFIDNPRHMDLESKQIGRSTGNGLRTNWTTYSANQPHRYQNLIDTFTPNRIS
jgi:hypothetical protein